MDRSKICLIVGRNTGNIGGADTTSIISRGLAIEYKGYR